MTAPTVSVIIPAHNEARLLGATLEALHRATAPLPRTFEVLVVDDASTDGTAEVARQHGAGVLQVSHRQIAATRNAGAAASSGGYLLFLDADTLVDGEVVRAALRTLDGGAAGGGAAVRLAGDVARHARWAAGLFVLVFRITRIAPGCFLFCTREAFQRCGGFDERYFAGEDVAISRALARQGRFRILREGVRTSARKLQTFSALEHLRLLLRFAWRGRGLLRSRADLDLWYGNRRHGPD
ncbi:MAG TPA: glycosyltransferase [Luteimonas sp.]|nr:glycosyltransferase [Luteimonas sp.]